VGLTHHELCFGCGAANLFGLQLEVEPAPAGGVEGRFFVKQDHQGPSGGAHPGVIATALEETMALALAAEGLGDARLEWFELMTSASIPPGTFVTVDARLEADEGERLRLAARARQRGAEAGEVASARAVFVRAPERGAKDR
jgi:acyl-coenzyme A thioesterase PaaI-like protein